MSVEKKTVTLGVPTVKTHSAFDVMEQTGGGLFREEDCKIPMLVSSASNQVHFKVFPSLKDPISLVTYSNDPPVTFFFIWDYTFSLIVKVKKVTEHAVCKICFQLRRF